ncbi:MAG: hypothetical protein WCK67_11645 [bacterium]
MISKLNQTNQITTNYNVSTQPKAENNTSLLTQDAPEDSFTKAKPTGKQEVAFSGRFTGIKNFFTKLIGNEGTQLTKAVQNTADNIMGQITSKASIIEKKVLADGYMIERFENPITKSVSRFSSLATKSAKEISSEQLIAGYEATKRGGYAAAESSLMYSIAKAKESGAEGKEILMQGLQQLAHTFAKQPDKKEYVKPVLDELKTLLKEEKGSKKILENYTWLSKCYKSLGQTSLSNECLNNAKEIGSAAASSGKISWVQYFESIGDKAGLESYIKNANARGIPIDRAGINKSW